MKTRPISTVATYCLLALAGGMCMVLPDRILLAPTWADAADEPSAVHLVGTGRTFVGAHPDFPADGVRPTGLYAGLALSELDETGVPRYAGPGEGVRESARDRLDRPVAPHLAFRRDRAGLRLLFVTRRTDDWTIGELVKRFLFESWGYAVSAIADDARPSAYREAIDTHDVIFIGQGVEASAIENKFDYPLRTASIGIVNESRSVVGCAAAGGAFGLGIVGPDACGSDDFATTHVDIAGAVHWTTASLPTGPVALFSTPQRMYGFPRDQVAPGATAVGRHVTDGRPQLLVVDRGGLLYAGDEAEGRRVHLPFVGWSDDLTTVTLDGQRLVHQLVDWAAGKDGDRLGDPLGTSARLTGERSSTGITSAASFSEWFRDVEGVTVPIPHALTLVRRADGVYLFDDTLDPSYRSNGGYRPGREGAVDPGDGSAVEGGFTASFATRFTHESRKQPFIQVGSNAEVWAYIDGRLVIDLGGVRGAMTQRIDLTQLGLEDGRRYGLRFFVAYRGAGACRLRLETDIVVAGAASPGF